MLFPRFRHLNHSGLGRWDVLLLPLQRSPYALAHTGLEACRELQSRACILLGQRLNIHLRKLQ